MSYYCGSCGERYHLNDLSRHEKQYICEPCLSKLVKSQQAVMSKEDVRLGITGGMVLLAFYVVTYLISGGAIKWI